MIECVSLHNEDKRLQMRPDVDFTARAYRLTNTLSFIDGCSVPCTSSDGAHRIQMLMLFAFELVSHDSYGRVKATGQTFPSVPSEVPKGLFPLEQENLQGKILICKA